MGAGDVSRAICVADRPHRPCRQPGSRPRAAGCRGEPLAVGRCRGGAARKGSQRLPAQCSAPAGTAEGCWRLTGRWLLAETQD